jgi:hypothetical protein
MDTNSSSADAQAPEFIATSGGPHSPEQWAAVTSKMVCDVSQIVDDRQEAAKKLQHVISAILGAHYLDVIRNERIALKDDPRHVNRAVNVARAADDIITTITWAAHDTPWADHWASPAVTNVARDVVKTHLETAVHCERLWHCDRNPDCEQVRLYKQFFGA